MLIIFNYLIFQTKVINRLLNYLFSIQQLKQNDLHITLLFLLFLSFTDEILMRIYKKKTQKNNLEIRHWFMIFISVMRSEFPVTARYLAD